jgi:pimeloyl-ACP methyl ester carboxylesterase
VAEPAAAPTASSDRTVAGDGGVDLHVTSWGDKSSSTVVLVHGFPDTSAVWTLVAEALADHGHHVVAYDVRGAGRSGAPDRPDGYALDHLIGDLAAVVEAVSPDRPVHLVGHDWGSIQSWPALADPRLAGRIASFTSISGPPLDHAGRWLRARLRDRSFLTLLRQGVRSSYVMVFHLPGLARGAVAARGAIGRTRGLWARTLRRVDGARVDDEWPAPTFGTDVAHGMQLYRANFRRTMRDPGPARPFDGPVLLVIPTRDRFVPGWLFEGIEEIAPDLRQREVRATHWVVRSQPVDVASWVASLAAEVDGAAAPTLEEARP